MKTSSFKYAASVIIMLLPAIINAEETKFALDPIIITAPKNIQPFWLNSGNYSGITQENIDITSHTHINQILSQSPGVWISSGSGQEHLTAIRSASLTGPGACGAFLYLQDNIPIRPAGFCNINNLFEINSEQAGNIEVIRGPSSSVFGGNALNGLINVTTREPALQDETQVILEGGPYDFHRIKLTNTLREESSAVRLDFNSANDNGYRDFTGYGQQKLNLRIDNHGAAWNSSTVISGSLLNQETGAYVEGSDAYKDPDLKRGNPSPEAYRDAWSSRIYSQFSKQSGPVQMVISPYWRRSQMDFLMHFLPGTPTEKNEQTSAGVQSNMQWQNAEHIFTGGIRVEGAEVSLLQEQSSPEVFGKLPQGKHYDFDVDTRHLAAYIGANWHVSDKLRVLNSLRYEYLYYDYDNHLLDGNTREDGSPCVSPDGCRYTRPADRSDNFNDGALRLGLTYDFHTSHQFFASLGSGFSAPQATDLYRLQAGQLSAEIDSEQMNSIEIGFNSHGVAFNSQISFYLQKKDNIIYRNADRLVYNDGASKSEGVELELFYQINNEQSLQFSGTYARHRYDNSWGNEVTEGDEMDTAPRRLAQLSWQWIPASLWEGKTFWNLQAVHTGRYYMDAENAHVYPGHTIFNGSMGYQANSKIRLSARLTNLTNRTYAERADFAFGDERYFPGTPRAMWLAIHWIL